MRHCIIVVGGHINDIFAKEFIEKERPELCIAADSGMNFFYRNKLTPDWIIGDFDSASSEALDYFGGQPDISLIRLNPVKDDTDTESAIRKAIALGAEKITLLGATGTRIDHLLGNIELLGIGLQNHIPRKGKSGIRAAVIREKGCQCERETSYALYLAGFDVKDVHMTDLASGRETLEDVNMIVFCGGFSNSDVLGSAKGWAGGFLYNEKAKKALDNFYARPDTLSLGICNGCQLMAELGVVYPEHEKKHKMLHNDSHKFESNFISVEIPKNHSVMFGSLSGSKLGIWVAHGEGKFSFPYEEKEYHIALKYNYEGYPANPNGSPWSVAGVCSHDGRHLAMMPHLERAMFPWQCGYYPEDRRGSDEVTPWIEGFVNARKWIEEHKK